MLPALNLQRESACANSSSLPLAAQQTRVCSRCRASMETGWRFCGVCGQKSRDVKGKHKQQDKPLEKRTKPTTLMKLDDEEEKQKDLKYLPSSLLAGLNAVLKGYEDGVFSEQQEATQRKHLLVNALELESAMQIEDLYMRLDNEKKVKKIAGPSFDAPRFNPAAATATTTLPSIRAAVVSGDSHATKRASVVNAKEKSKSLKRATGDKETVGYLDEVGSVTTYYQEYLERERQLAGLRRAIAEEKDQDTGDVNTPEDEAERRERISGLYNLQQELLDEQDEEAQLKEHLVKEFLVDGALQRVGTPAASVHSAQMRVGRGDDKDDEEEGGEEGEAADPAQPTVMFWGTLKERGRYFLPRDGVDAGHVVDAQQDIVDAHKAFLRFKAKNMGKGGQDESEAEADEPPLSWQQVLLEAEQIKAAEEPWLWTPVIRPLVTVGEGLDGFLDDRPLSRPLTPEVTSDDEDEKFEKQLLEMEAKKAAEKLAAGQDATAAGEVTEQSFATGPAGTIEVEGDDEDVHELDHIDPEAAAERAALIKAQRRERLNRARRQMAFDLAYSQAQEQGKPKPKLFKPKKKKPSEMNEEELREYELQKAIDAADNKDEDEDDDDESTLTPDPIVIRTALPAFNAYSIIARMYKHSLMQLRQAVEQAEFRLVDEILPPPRSGRPLPFEAFKQKLDVVEEALLLAPGVEIQAKTEFAVFQERANKARAEAANRVADALEEMTRYHNQYNERYKKIAATTSDPRELKEKLEALTTKADADLLQRGEALRALQAEETKTSADIKAQEFVTIETVRKWRPLHAEWIGKARWKQKALQTIILTAAAKVIQRNARRRLLFMFWGEPSETWLDPVSRQLEERRKNKGRGVEKHIANYISTAKKK